MLWTFLLLRCWWDWRAYCRFQQSIGAKKSSQPQLRLQQDMNCFSHQASKYSTITNLCISKHQTMPWDSGSTNLQSCSCWWCNWKWIIGKRRVIVALMIDNDKNCGEKQPSICKLDWNTHSWMMDSWFGSTNDSTFTTILYNSPIPPD